MGKRAGKEGKPTAVVSKRAVPKAESTLAAHHGGVVKRKHGEGKQALVQRLQAEAPAHKSAKEKSRQKRAAKSKILGAVDGMKASLEELLEANERMHKASDSSLGSLTSKKRQKLVADETSHMQQVLVHPAFIADPFAALQEHIRNTVGAMHENEPKFHKKKKRSANSSGGTAMKS